MDPITVAAAAVKVLGPFMPFLIDFAQTTGKKWEEMIAERGGDAAWTQACNIWSKISERFRKDAVVTGAATMVADAPEDATRQRLLAEVLAQRLESDPALAQELLALMGGSTGVQQVVGGNETEITEIRMKMARSGEQSVRGGDAAKIQGVDMQMGFDKAP